MDLLQTNEQKMLSVTVSFNLLGKVLMFGVNFRCSLSGKLPLDLSLLLPNGVLHSSLVLQGVDDGAVLPPDLLTQATQVAVLNQTMIDIVQLLRMSNFLSLKVKT